MVPSKEDRDDDEGREDDPDSDDGSVFRDVLRQIARADARTPPIFLARGTPLGPYQIVDLLGRGGMGVVYRATDTRLGREVALKVLRGSAAGSDRRRRFSREARSAAAINHPNVATVFEVGESGEHLYFAMELVEGVTLRRRLAAGPIAVEEALSLVRQIALGLAVAHSKGIVHRDLKPENVMLTPAGAVKVLDFGLAKIDSPPSNRPGETLGHRETETLEGAVLGTPGYMAPEQATGERVDARADVFALGIVLYELLTGVRPGLLGRGPLIQDERLEDIVHRCIAASPSDRFADAAEVLSALDERASQPPRSSRSSVAQRTAGLAGPHPEHSTVSTPDTFMQPSAGKTAPESRSRWAGARRAALAISLLAAALVVTVAPWRARSTSGATPATRTAASADFSTLPATLKPTSFVDSRLTFYPPSVAISSLTVSPDGQSFAYFDDEAIWLASVDGSPKRRVALPAGEKRVPQQVRFFPDGKHLLVGEFAPKDERTWVLALDGSAPEPGREASCFAISPNGRLLAFRQFGERIVVGPVHGGPTTYIESIKTNGRVAMSWSPDSTRLAIGRELDGACFVEVARADGSWRRTVASDDHCSVALPQPTWTANDRIAFPGTPSSGAVALMEVSLDASDVATGTPRRLWAGPSAQVEDLEYRNGRFFFIRVESQRDVYLGRLDAQRKLEKPLARFTMSDDDDRLVGWEPDGRIVYASGRSGQSIVYVNQLDETTKPIPLTQLNVAPFAVLPDGDVMAFRGAPDRGEGLVSRIKLDGTVRDLFSVGDAGFERAMPLRCAQCARAVQRCILGDVEGDETSFSAFDPQTGVRSAPFAHRPSDNAWACSLSADGTQMFLPLLTEGLEIVSIASGAARRVPPPRGGQLQSTSSWPNSNDLVGTGALVDHAYGLLRLDGEGAVLEPLWTSESTWISGPLIAPNGRDIAVNARAFATDVYILAPADAK